jgi:hypothetical protein
MTAVQCSDTNEGSDIRDNKFKVGKAPAAAKKKAGRKKKSANDDDLVENIPDDIDD